jgi:hypothetical protein
VGPKSGLGLGTAEDKKAIKTTTTRTCIPLIFIGGGKLHSVAAGIPARSTNQVKHSAKTKCQGSVSHCFLEDRL